MPQALAAVLLEPGKPMVIETIELDEPQQGEVLVRMKAAGVCHSDWHVIAGDLPMPMPLVLGHEGAGVVEAVGPGVSSVRVGDAVWPIWRSSCGRCDFCQSGRPALCDLGTAMRFTGLMPDGKTRMRRQNGQPIHHYAGVSTFSSLSVMPEAAVVRIEPPVDWQQAALISCGVITGVGAVTHAAQVPAASTVVVFGCGGIGLNIIQGARLVGARQIIAVDNVAAKERFARQLGATDFVHADGHSDPVAAVRALCGGQGCDFTFEAVGLAQSVEWAFDSLRKGGTCVVSGIARQDARPGINANQLVYGQKTLKGTLYGHMRPRVDLERLMALARAGRLDLDGLLTKTWPLEQINEAYASLLRGEVARSLIVWP